MHKRKTIKIQEKPRKKRVFSREICISFGKMCIFMSVRKMKNGINDANYGELGRKSSDDERIRLENAFSLSTEDKIE